MPLILETILQVCIMDVEATVRQVAKKCLKDLATPKETRRQRAEGLIELGRMFQDEAERYKKNHMDQPVDVMRQMEAAFVRMAQEADQRENNNNSGNSQPQGGSTATDTTSSSPPL